MTFGCGCGGWTYSEPLRRGWQSSLSLDLQRTSEECCREGAAVQVRHVSCCTVHLHFLGEEHILGLKSFNQYPSPSPFTPQQRETCRITLPIGTPADGRHIHIYTIHALIVENYQEHAHARVCSALTYSVLQCPGVMLGFTGDGFWAHLAACASRDEISPGPTMEHRTSDVLTAITSYMNTSSINTGTF